MSDDTMLDLMSGAAPRTEQRSLFGAAAEQGSAGVEVEEKKSRRTSRSKKKKVVADEFGRGKVQLMGYGRITMDMLSVKYQIGVLAQTARDIAWHGRLGAGRPEALSWYRQHFGWVPGWWNPHPTGNRPKEIDDTLVDQLYVTIRERMNEYKQRRANSAA